MRSGRAKARLAANKPDALPLLSNYLDTIHREGELDVQSSGSGPSVKEGADRLTKELRGIGAALAAFGKAYVKGTGARKLSKSARARIAAAQRARWAKVRASAERSDKVVPIRRKRTLSAARAEEDRRCAEGERRKGEGEENSVRLDVFARCRDALLESMETICIQLKRRLQKHLLFIGKFPERDR